MAEHSHDAPESAVLRIIELLKRLLKEKPMPEALKEKLRSLIEDLEAAVAMVEPCLVIAGRRGAGKSTLINALFGAPVAKTGAVTATTKKAHWYLYSSKRGSIYVLDTRGLGEGEDAGGSPQQALEQIRHALQERPADGVLFLCKAKEVDARIQHDLHALAEILVAIEEMGTPNPFVIGVVTQVDELDPPDVCEPPFGDPEKQRNIKRAREVLHQRLCEAIGEERLLDTIPICAYVRFDEKGQIVHDRRWQIDRLVKLLVEKLPKSKQYTLLRVARIKHLLRDRAKGITEAAAGIAGLIGVSPLPFSDLPALTALQIAVIAIIAVLGGRQPNTKTVTEFLAAVGANVGLAFGFRELARQLIKLLPGAGEVISGGIAAAGTWAIGQAAIAYFIDRLPVDEKDLQQFRNRALAKWKNGTDRSE